MLQRALLKDKKFMPSTQFSEPNTLCNSCQAGSPQSSNYTQINDFIHAVVPTSLFYISVRYNYSRAQPIDANMQ